MAAIVLVGVLAGVVVPDIIHHGPTPNLGPGATTTVPPSATTTVPSRTVPASTVPATTVPASTAPASTAPASTAPASTAPATTVPPATTAPATTAPTGAATTVPASGQGGATGPGQSLSNSAVSVVAPAGWSQSSNSDATDLFLLGPDGLAVEFFTEQVQPGTTITDVFQSELAQRQKSSPDAKVCEQTTAAGVPGTPPVNGYYEGICFTLTPQNGSATPYEDAAFAGLASTGNGELLVQESLYTPQSTSSATLKQDVVPLLRTVHWLQLSGS